MLRKVREKNDKTPSTGFSFLSLSLNLIPSDFALVTFSLNDPETKRLHFGMSHFSSNMNE